MIFSHFVHFVNPLGNWDSWIKLCINIVFLGWNLKSINWSLTFSVELSNKTLFYTCEVTGPKLWYTLSLGVLWKFLLACIHFIQNGKDITVCMSEIDPFYIDKRCQFWVKLILLIPTVRYSWLKILPNGEGQCRRPKSPLNFMILFQFLWGFSYSKKDLIQNLKGFLSTFWPLTTTSSVQ